MIKVKNCSILGCPIAISSPNSIFKQLIDSNVHTTKGFYTVAINAEKIMRYRKNAEIKNIIDNSDFPFPDGSGALLGLKLLYGISSKKINMPVVILEICNKNIIPLYMLGSTQEVIDQATIKVKEKYKNLPLVGYNNGFFKDELVIIKQIKESKAKVVMIAMGSPGQEQLAQRMLKKLPEVIFIGCGGAFDILAGKVIRAPVWIQNAHLEWLYRLIQDPRRIVRQRVLPVFLFLVIKEYLKKQYKKLFSIV